MVVRANASVFDLAGWSGAYLFFFLAAFFFASVSPPFRFGCCPGHASGGVAACQGQNTIYGGMTGSQPLHLGQAV